MKITGQLGIDKKRFDKIKKNIKDILDFKKVVEKESQGETTELLESCLLGAINLDSSDVHIEIEKDKVKIRLRIDGLLHDAAILELKPYDLLLSRIKLLSGIKLNINKKAQDGRFTVLFEDVSIEVRVSTLPSEYGETIALRILNPKNLIEIEDLGVEKKMVDILEKEIRQPNGIIIASGPTGGGKTTTLYAILKKIQNSELKIITIEDPIEYHLKGISQTQTKPKEGYDFPNGLMAIMRQDPDVILVGEIRDLETAKISLQASLTGHLVLTTIHSNDATGVVARLGALGEKLTNIASAINLVIGQRLVRKVCPKCSTFSPPSKNEMKLLKDDLASVLKDFDIPSIDENLKIPHLAKGCSFCNFTGYKGQVGIFEFFLVDSYMENFILKSPSSVDLRKEAQKRGMITMREYGLIKVLRGMTTIEEINRVTKSH